MLVEISGEITPERMKTWSQSKNTTQLWMWRVVEVKSEAVKNNIAYESVMLGSWIKANCQWTNNRWWVNFNILGINELKWAGMGEFNSHDHNIYYCGQESFRRNGVAIIVNKRVQNAIPGYNLKNDKTTSVHFQGKPFNIIVIQVYAPGSNAEEAEKFYEDLQDLLELTPKKDIFFIILYWHAKVGSQELSGVTGKFGLGVQNKAGQRITEFCQENELIIANTLFQQHKKRLHMGITRWSTLKSDWLYSLQTKMEKFYTVSKNKTGSWLWLKSWTPYCQIQT